MARRSNVGTVGVLLVSMMLSACSTVVGDQVGIPFDRRTVDARASLTPGDFGCGARGLYRAESIEGGVIVTGSWVSNCDAETSIELTIMGTSALIDSVEGVSKGRTLGTVSPDRSLEVSISSFDPAGVVSGFWNNHLFWAVVDRPTHVKADADGIIRLLPGQGAIENGCFFHYDGSELDEGGVTVHAYGNSCAVSSIEARLTLAGAAEFRSPA